MNKPVFYIALLFCLCASFGNAQQNLVYNGGFEDITNCNCDINFASGWYSPTIATPDLFNPCSSSISFCGVPTNIFGFQLPYEGDGYAGIVGYSESLQAEGVYREYICSKLISPLENGQYYSVSFHICAAETSPVAINNIAAGFLSGAVNYNHFNPIGAEHQLDQKAIISDTAQWTKISWIYKAIGDENYIVIGNFHSDLETDTVGLTQSSEDTYYYIDGVEVEKLNIDLPNIFTPNGDGINDVVFINDNLISWKIYLINRWGNTILQTDFLKGWNGTDCKGAEVDEGTYFYVIEDNSDKSLITTGFIQLVR